MSAAVLDSPLARVVALREEGGVAGARWIAVAGRRFQVGERCAECGKFRRRIRLFRPESATLRRCACCRAPMHVTGIDIVDSLPAHELPASTLRRPLRRLGVRTHDVLSLNGRDDECHLAIVGTETCPEEPTDARSDLQRLAR